jgi:hypothetical protein
MTAVVALVLTAVVPADLRFEPWFIDRGVAVSIARVPKGIPWVRGEAELPVSTGTVFELLTNYDGYEEFMSPVVKEVTVLERAPTGTRLHFIWRYPFPFRNRDAVVLYQAEPSEGGAFVITWRDDARRGDPSEGVRIARVAGETRVEPLGSLPRDVHVPG